MATIGPYRLLEKLGEGGMGEVWRAEQAEPVRREVALKLVRAGLDGRDVAARFAAEGHALARMEHPGIARIFEVGEADDGRPFFAMELVRGEPITDYCDRRELGLRERIELVSQVCAAVQHAHQKAVLHRDLKPSNLLVTEHDGEPTVRVIDFGIAKALASSLTEETLHTRLGQVVGTPAYMSPEQADPFHLLLDTRSDVYSLGVVLYELLTGVVPFPVDDAENPAAALTPKLGRKEAPRASTRARSAEPRAAAVRGCAGARQLSGRLRGELDWIVLRSLDPDPERRYPSALAFGRDLGRHLAGEPVDAGPPGAGYRLRKFVARHRVAVVAAVAVLLALVVGGALAAAGFVRAQRAELEARRQAATAREVASFLQDLFRGADPRRHRGEEVSARQLLDDGVAGLDGELSDRPEVKAAILFSMAEVYRELGEADEAERLLRESIALRETELRGDGGERRAVERRSGELDLARARVELGDLLRHRDRFDEAAEWIESAAPLLGPVDERSAEVHAKYWNDLGLVLHAASRYDDAEAAHQRSLVLREETFGARSAEVATARHNLAMTVFERDPEAAIEMERQVLALRREILGDDHPRVASSFNGLGAMLGDLERWDEAAEMLEASLAIRRRLGVEDQRVANTLGEIAWIRFRARDYAEAERAYRSTLDLAERTAGRVSRAWAFPFNELGLLMEETARFEEAEAIYRESVEVRRELFGESHSSVHNAERYLGSLLSLRGRPEDARPRLEAAAAGYREVAGAEHSSTLGAEVELARLLVVEGRLEEAIEEAGELLERVEAAGFSGTVLRPRLLAIRGRAERLAGTAAAAVASLEEAVDGYEGSSTRSLVEKARAQAELGLALEEAGRPEEARRAFEASRGSWAVVDAPHSEVAQVDARLAGRSSADS